MVYGILGLINFAHGEVVMIGAMVAISVVLAIGTGGLPAPIVLLAGVAVAIPACMLLGALLERVAYRPLRDAPRLTALITAIGMSIILQNLAMIAWGRQYLSFPPLLPNEPHAFFGATVTGTQLLIVALTVSLMGALLLLIHRTRLGRAMRATSQSPALAGLMGVDVNRIIMLTFMLGSALAAVAGVMIAGYYGQAHYYMGFMLGLKAFTAAVLGGIGNVSGAMLGGLALGVIESLGAGYIGALTGGFLGSHYQDVFAFAVLILVLVFRPSGLLGERVADRA
jgi:branched-chain amino acid transport system permease protein